MLPPIRYMGGKSRLAKRIVELIPPHAIYLEPFAGSLAVLLEKPKIDHGMYQEVVNDKSNRIANLWKQLRDNGEALKKKLLLTPYSRVAKRAAYDTMDEGTPLEKARKYFMCLNMGFGGTPRSFAYSAHRSESHQFYARVERIDEVMNRIREVIIENGDALNLLTGVFNVPETFVYLDPPYPGTDQDFYGGYTLDDYRELLHVLDSTFVGSFLLSNYEQPSIKYPDSWERHEFSLMKAISRNKNNIGTEILWYRPALFKPRKKFAGVYAEWDLETRLRRLQYKKG